MYDVSVIIPVYNAENTLKRCIDSVINQTLGFENIELILYDDASTDNSREIILEYANQYSNIIPILSDKGSGGPSHGRNESIKIATADYIMFMDNDDEYELDICEKLYNEIKNENADLVTCNHINLINDEIKAPRIYEHGNGIIDGNKIIFLDSDVFNFYIGVVWNSIFKKEIILENNIKFPISMAEDILFKLEYLKEIKKIVYLKDYFGYIRHVKNDSLSNSRNLNNLKKYIKLAWKTIEKYENININSFFNIPDYIIPQFYVSNLIKYNSKEEIYGLFELLREFELETNDNTKMEMMIKIANNLILNKHYRMALIYLKLLGKFYSNNTLKKIHNKIN